MNLNSMYENRRIAAPEADRYGHVKEFTSDTDIAQCKVSEAIPVNQIVTALRFRPGDLCLDIWQ